MGAGTDFIPLERVTEQFLFEIRTQKFVYCQHEVQRESFSLIFWTIPLDTWSWAGLAGTSMIIIIFLRGKWLEVVGILLRQATSIVLSRHTMLVLLMLTTTVVTCCYESIISGFLIVPPPIIVAKTLKDLIDKGYKIINMKSKSKLSEVVELFRRENITSPSVESSIINGSWVLFLNGTLLGSCNTTTLRAKSDFGNKDLSLSSLTRKHCYEVSQTSFLEITADHLFSGHDGWKFYQVLKFLTESGIMQMYHSFAVFVEYYKFLWERERTEYFASQLFAFKLFAWKLTSIFLVWAFLTGVAGLVFIFEYFPRQIIYGLERLIRLMKESIGVAVKDYHSSLIFWPIMKENFVFHNIFIAPKKCMILNRIPHKITQECF